LRLLRHANDNATSRDHQAFTHRYFGQDAEVWLFGSRADDKKKGGNYDFIEASFTHPDLIIEHKITMIAELQSTSTFEEEKIDLIVKRRSSKKRRGKVVTPEQLMRIYLDECSLHVKVLAEALEDAQPWLPFSAETVQYLN
jgi:hypothetical protein